MDDYIFESCGKINDLLNNSKEKEAGEELIKLLDYHKSNQIEYTPLVNHLLREAGLYSHIHPETSGWDDRFAYEVFKEQC
jgi:hypothetical protein